MQTEAKSTSGFKSHPDLQSCSSYCSNERAGVPSMSLHDIIISYIISVKNYWNFWSGHLSWYVNHTHHMMERKEENSLCRSAFGGL